jgi:hypothetical protein
MMPIISPIEIKNIGGIKLLYNIDTSEINSYNSKNDDFPIFKLENTEGNLSPGDVKYIIGSFRPLTNKFYSVTIPVTFTDESNEIRRTKISLSGYGYHPLTVTPPPFESTFRNMPKNRKYNSYEGHLIQRCGVSLEEINFGCMEEKQTSKTFIIYNYSMTDAFMFEFNNPGFNMKDDILEFDPKKDKLEPNTHLLVKIKITPKGTLSSYEGEIEIKIIWNSHEANPKVSDRESLYIRIIKKPLLNEVSKNIFYIY